jgi:sigma-B regulation protein RsbU (phosphoserine phosphatase)
MYNRGPDRRGSGPGQLPPGMAFERRLSADRRSNGFISQLQLFLSIPYAAVERVLSECSMRDVEAGEVLLRPGQVNHAIHLLVSGRLRIHFDSTESADHIPIEEGSCFGELSIIDGRPASAYVVADLPSRVLAIDEHVFWEKLIPQPGVARNLLSVLSDRMRVNREIILDRMKDRLALEHLHKELSIARSIQLSMLPPGDRLFPERPDVCAYGIMEPAKDVGGDFYDAFFVSPNRLFVAVGDVSGKGVPAALFMARAITQLRIEAVREQSPAAILERVNRALSIGNDAGMFVTLFLGVLDVRSGVLRYSSAGHNPPLIIGPVGATYLNVPKGIVAGMLEQAKYAEDAVTISVGSSLLIYTDGVTEAMNAGGDFYTDERLLEIAGEGAGADAAGLVSRVQTSVVAFAQGAPQADDITLLALHNRGNPRPAAAS